MRLSVSHMTPRPQLDCDLGGHANAFCLFGKRKNLLVRARAHRLYASSHVWKDGCVRTLPIEVVQQQFGQSIIGQFQTAVVCLVETLATQQPFLPQLQIAEESYLLCLMNQRMVEDADGLYRRLYEVLSGTRDSLSQT